jgi:pimeloyl-ACP methyl ester carboxylesterase
MGVFMSFFRFFANLKLLVAVIIGVFTAVTIPSLVGISAADAVTCQNISLTVTVAGESGPLTGTLCSPAGASTVQLLVPGFTYDRNYWDFPFHNDQYSYVKRANAAGYATLAIDRIGSGESWKPLSLIVTHQNSVDAVHQLVQALRNGNLGSQFSKVVLVGHSYGSLVSLSEAGTFHDVDALVATGSVHRPNLVNAGAAITPAITPAILDPKFANSGLDPVYVTTRVGARNIFYNTANSDPAVINADEQLKAVDAMLDLVGGLATTVTTESARINIPVFAVVGAKDQYACGLLAADCSSSQALANFERPFYGPGATVEGYLVPNSGHDINLEFTASQAYTQILSFVGRDM